MKINLYSLRSFIVFSSLLIVIFTGCKKEIFEEQTDAAIVPEESNARSFVSKPNVILIIADDLGYEVPSYLGGQTYQTPTLDFMAANGIQFRQAYCHPDGFPSRLALLTGKYNFRNYTIWGSLPNTEKTIGNLMQDAGYATCYTGKWQCRGGGERINSAGFEKYRVFLPYADNQRIGRYKNPILYENNNYLPADSTFGRYSEDMYVDYLSEFIQENKNHPFFAIYAHNLPAGPYVPTPDDPEYANWNTANDKFNGDTKYFPSMVKYMDKSIGKIIKKVHREGLLNNTIFIFTADNATHHILTSVFNGIPINGGKTETSRHGTNIPFIAFAPGQINPNKINRNTLIDFTDLMPTMAEIAETFVPVSYGTTDGVSFYDNMMNVSGTDRDWVFCHWDNNSVDLVKPERFVNNTTYKLYETKNFERFYNIQKDIFESAPLNDSLLSPAELKIKEEFKAVLSEMK